VATTAGAYTSTAAIGDSIISSSSHLIVLRLVIEKVKNFKRWCSNICWNYNST
jgi:hypothetical protein